MYLYIFVVYKIILRNKYISTLSQANDNMAISD